MAKKILIATHGHLASGIKSAIGVLAGEPCEIQTIDAYTDDEPGDYTPKIEAFIASVGEGDQGFIFTDILSGSVNQRVVRSNPFDNPNLTLVTGTNLMVVLGVALDPRIVTRDVLQEIIEQSNVETVEPEPVDEEVANEDDFLS